VKPLKNNFMVDQEILNNTPEHISKMREGIGIVQDFQHEVNYELEHYFCNKL
jgi:hypothetical protein